MDLTVTDINGQSELLTDYKQLKRKRRVNGEYSLSFILLETTQNQHSYPLVQEESIIECDGQKYRVKGMKKRPIGESTFKQVRADHIFFDLIDHHVYEKMTGTHTINEYLDFIFAGTNYTYQVTDSFETEDLGEFGDDNGIALITEVLNTFGAEVEQDNYHNRIYQEIGQEIDFQFRYKHNLKTIEQDVNTDNLSTYIKGFGKDGLEVEFISPKDKANGGPFERKHAPPVRDDRYTTTIGLLGRLINELNDVPEVSFTITFAELKRAGYEYEQVYLGSRSYIIHEPMGIDINARVLFYEEDLLEIEESKVEIANFRKNMIDITADFKKVEKTVGKVVDDNGRVRYNVLDQATQIATESLNNALTELEFTEAMGIIARNPNDPNQLVVFKSSGIGISLDGGKTFKDAITKDGFVLSAGAIGQLEANNIKIGVGTTYESGYNPSTKEKQIVRSASAPTDKTVLWLDTSVLPNIWKSWDGQAWIRATPTQANEIKMADGSTVESKKTTWDKSSIINQDSNFEWTAGGFIAKNPSDPNQMVKFTSGGIGISNDGGTTFTTVITGAEVQAQRLRAVNDLSSTNAIEINGNNVLAYSDMDTNGRQLFSVYDTLPTLYDGNETDPQIRSYGKIYTQRVSVYVPAKTYADSEFVATTVTINDYSIVAIANVSAILCQSVAKEFYAYETKDGRKDELGNAWSAGVDLYSFELRLSPQYAFTSGGTYVDVDIVIIGWR